MADPLDELLEAIATEAFRAVVREGRRRLAEQEAARARAAAHAARAARARRPAPGVALGHGWRMVDLLELLDELDDGRPGRVTAVFGRRADLAAELVEVADLPNADAALAIADRAASGTLVASGRPVRSLRWEVRYL